MMITGPVSGVGSGTPSRATTVQVVPAASARFRSPGVSGLSTITLEPTMW